MARGIRGTNVATRATYLMPLSPTKAPATAHTVATMAWGTEGKPWPNGAHSRMPAKNAFTASQPNWSSPITNPGMMNPPCTPYVDVPTMYSGRPVFMPSSPGTR